MCSWHSLDVQVLTSQQNKKKVTYLSAVILKSCRISFLYFAAEKKLNTKIIVINKQQKLNIAISKKLMNQHW